MIDVSERSPSLRKATAEARVNVRPATIEAIRNHQIPKGDVGEITRGTGLLGLKKTSQLLPFCHIITLDHADIQVTIEDDAIRIVVAVAAIARTGVEVEAMTGASIAALNAYDMVKPIDPEASISSIKVLEKSGGRSQFKQRFERPIQAGILVVSDSVAAGAAVDSAGAEVRRILADHNVDVAGFEVVADDPEAISKMIISWTDEHKFDLVFAVGGTGLGPRDQTPETLANIIEREIPGIGEHMRAYGSDRTPLAALSRSCAGQRGNSVMIALPGSRKAAAESMHSLMPWVLHAIKVFDKNYRHGA